MAKKIPSTMNGLMGQTKLAVNKLGYQVRKIWYCNAGWGLVYVNIADNKTITHTYFKTIEQCIKQEHRRVVLKLKTKGGFSLK